jgi:hypothetical protein
MHVSHSLSGLRPGQTTLQRMHWLLRQRDNHKTCEHSHTVPDQAGTAVIVGLYDQQVGTKSFPSKDRQRSQILGGLL